jgi:hypothetical protein
MSPTTRPPRCSRGELLRAHRSECGRAAQYIGTRGLDGAGRRIIDDSRGRLVRTLMQTWTSRRVIHHIRAIIRTFERVEYAVIGWQTEAAG